jgi:NADPH:quinone reductase-like Zn-dependent oxidoreductase
MQSYRLESTGATAAIVLGTCDQPRAGANEIVVRVRAAALNKRDLYILNGSYPLPAKPRVVPLSDGAGEVVAVGAQVTRFTVGDRVAGNYFARWKSGPLQWDEFDQLGCALDGMLTEFALLHEQWAVRVPEHLSWEQAATLPCAGVTAWNCLVGPVPIVAGQTVLTIGSGGVSLFALQFAKTLGARVIAVTSSADKVARLQALGADVVINTTEHPQWGTAVRDATAGAGVDLVVETFGADTIEQSMRAVGMHGQVMLLIVRGMQKPQFQISAQTYGASMATIRRVFVGSRVSFEAMNRAIGQSKLRPVIERVFPFSQAQQAYEHFARGRSFGKVVISNH